jgi:ADP-ribosylglycohydrolase
VLGAIAGDVIGSVHEFVATKTTMFELFPPRARFTDDSVLALAVADCLLTGGDYVDAFHDAVRRYPRAGFGSRFHAWATSESRTPYNSWGNGAAMRVPAVAYAFASLEAVLAEAARSAEATHNHPEGVKGAQATAAAVFMARHGDSKQAIKAGITRRFGYDLNPTIDALRPTYRFDESCQETVPPAIIAFLESDDFESAVRLAISLGGDADTLACITGAIAEAHYGGVPPAIAARTLETLDDHLRGVFGRFQARFGPVAT